MSDGKDSQVTVRKPRLNDQQKKLAAVMVGNGADDQRVCEQLSISKYQLKNLKEKEEFQAAVQVQSLRFAESQVNHKLRLIELNEKGYRALSENLSDDDAKVKQRALEYLFEQTGQARAPEKVAAGVEINLTGQTVNLQAAETLRDISRELPDIFKSLAEMDPEKHVRTGEEALPQALLAQVGDAVKRAEVVEADFVPVPEDSDDSES